MTTAFVLKDSLTIRPNQSLVMALVRPTAELKQKKQQIFFKVQTLLFFR